MKSDFSKRALDVLASAMGLLILSPVLLAIGLAVKGSSKGPILYLQLRVGRNGRPFKLIKFRSMQIHSDAVSRLTPAGDMRVTRLGKFLRRTNLDELPQLWNVLKGDLSLVGPRPEVPEFVDMDNPLWVKALTVRPGMTSPETVLYRREGDILARFSDPEEAYRTHVLPHKLSLACKYVDTRSLWGDIKTICATFVDIARR